MSDNYSFYVNQSALRETLEKYINMESILLQVKDNCINIFDLLLNFSGCVIDTFIADFDFFMNAGDYDEAYKKVKLMRELLEEVMYEVNKLLSRCEGFKDQLESDNYVEPGIPLIGEVRNINGGRLALNYEKVPVIKNLCEEIAEKNHHIRETLKGIIWDCYGIVPGIADDMDAVDVAARRINRVLNFRDSFEVYERGIRLLESEIEFRVKSSIEGHKNINKFIYRDLEDEKYRYMSNEELKFFILKLEANDDAEKMIDIATDIMSRDPSEWTVNEVNFLADTLDYAYNTGNVDMLNAYLSEMLNVSYIPREQAADSQYIISGDIGIISSVMQQLDIMEQGELYYTLNRIANMECSVPYTEREIPLDVKSETFSVHTEQISGRWHITVVADEKLIDDDMESNIFTITAYDMNEIISPEDEQLLLKLGFLNTEVQNMRMSIVTDSDVMFWDKMAALDYEEAFAVDPREFSTTGEQEFTRFANSLLYFEGGEEKLTTFINALLETNKERCFNQENAYYQVYLDILQTNSYKDSSMLEMSMWNVDLTDANIAEIKQYTQEVLMMNGLWSTLDMGTGIECFPERSGWNDLYGYGDGECTYQIQNLVYKTDDEDIPQLIYDLGLVKENEKEYIYSETREDNELKVSGSVMVNWDPEDTIYGEVAVAYREIDEEINALANRYYYNQFLNGSEFVSSFFGGNKYVDISTTVGIDSLRWVDINGSEDTQAAVEQIGNRLEMLPPVQEGLDVVSAYLEYVEEKKDLLTQREKIGTDTIMGQWGSSVTGRIGGELYVTYEGIFNPEIIQRVQEIEKYGLNDVLEQVNPNPDISSLVSEGGEAESQSLADMILADNSSEEVAEYLNILLYGRDDGDIKILDMKPEFLSECFALIYEKGNVNGYQYVREGVEEK